MCCMDTLDTEIQAAAKKRTRAEDAFKRADDELRDLLVRGRAEGKGPSHMAKLTGFTREWVAKIAPDPNATPKRHSVKAPKGTLDRIRNSED